MIHHPMLDADQEHRAPRDLIPVAQSDGRFNACLPLDVKQVLRRTFARSVPVSAPGGSYGSRRRIWNHLDCAAEVDQLQRLGDRLAPALGFAGDELGAVVIRLVPDLLWR